MSTVVALKVRASILRVPGDSPGLLIVDGQQWPFTLDRVWKSPVAPSVNMVVDVDFDGQGNITAITAVDPHQAAREKLNQIGGAAQQHGKEAALIARQGVGALAARMGKVALGAATILWIAWFFMPVLTVQQIVGARAITFWDFLALDLSNAMLPLQLVASSHGLLSIIGLLAIAAPFAAPFIRRPRAKFLYAMPLLYLILVGVAVVYDCNQAIDEAAGMAKRSVTVVQGNPRWNQQQQLAMQGVTDRLEQLLLDSVSIDYGAFVIVIASFFLAIQTLRHPGYENTGRLAVSPIGGVSSGGESCAKCAKPMGEGDKFCTVCGAQRTLAAGS